MDKVFDFCRIEFSALAVAHKAVNVGQGFIDYEPPHYLIDFYKEAVEDPNILLHQYTRGFVSSIDGFKEDFNTSILNRVIDD